MNDERLAMTSDEAWTVLASSLEPVPPVPEGRDRLLEAVARAAPYRALVPGFAAAFDLTEKGVHALLARMGDPREWMPGIGGMIAFLDFEAGPRLDAGHCGVARMRDGGLVPHHRHRAREITFVLRGAMADGDGNTFRAGEVIDAPPGSAHSLRAIGESEAKPEALVAVLLAEIEIDGAP